MAHDTCEVNLVVSSITIYKIYDVYCGIYYIKITTSQIRNMGGEFFKSVYLTMSHVMSHGLLHEKNHIKVYHMKTRHYKVTNYLYLTTYSMIIVGQ